MNINKNMNKEICDYRDVGCFYCPHYNIRNNKFECTIDDSNSNDEEYDKR